jgi:uncharacterized coiled-coil DUF342 family protein
MSQTKPGQIRTWWIKGLDVYQMEPINIGKTLKVVAHEDYEKLQTELDSMSKVYWMNREGIVKLKSDYQSLMDQVEMLANALKVIEAAYPTDGERMAHQDYAKKALAAFNKFKEGLK